MAQFSNTIGSLPIQAGLPANWTKQTGQVDISVVANNQTQYSDRVISFDNYVSSTTITWNVPGVLGDSEILTLMKFSGQAQPGIYYISCGIRLQASAETGYYLGFLPTSTGGGPQIRLAQIDNGQVNGELQTVAFTWATETWYWIRLRATGSSLQAKVWQIGDAEPGAFQINTSDITYTTGRVGIRCRSNSINADVANFWVASAGDTATRGNSLDSGSIAFPLTSTFKATPVGLRWGTNKAKLTPTSDLNARFVQKPNISAVLAATAGFRQSAASDADKRIAGNAEIPIGSVLKVNAYIPYKSLPKHYEGDRYRRRFAPDYNDAFNDLLPSGAAWPREPDTTFQKAVAGLTAIWGTTVERLAELLLVQESDPRSTVVLLPEWERAWGLPDKCLAEPLTIMDRQRALVHKMTLLGAQSRDFFIGVAASIGYTIDIREWSPFMCGISMCGDTRLFTAQEAVSTSKTSASDVVPARVWQANGVAQIDTSQFKFGASSLLLNPATVDMIYAPAHSDWSLSNKRFTIEGFFSCNQLGSTNHRAIIGQSDAGLVARSFSICRTPNTGPDPINVIKAELFTNNGQQAIFGTTQFTDSLNTGFHHYRFVRYDSSIYLFIDGVLEGFLVMPSGTVVNSVTAPLAIGGFGDPAGATSANTWGGWIDSPQFATDIGRSISAFGVSPDAPVADQFTKSLLEFEGVDGARVFTETKYVPPAIEGIAAKFATVIVFEDTNNYRWEIGKPEMRFFWSVRVGAVRYTWFRASSGQAGVNHHLEFALATDLECILRRWKPAHTEIIFNYSPVNALDFSKPYDSSYYLMTF